MPKKVNKELCNIIPGYKDFLIEPKLNNNFLDKS